MRNLLLGTGLRWLWLTLVALVLDQATKLWVIANMSLYQSDPVVPLFNLTYVRNYGAAFSFLDDAGGWQRWFFAAIAFSVSALLLWWLKGNKPSDIRLNAAYTLILGGALGNLYDRIAYGYVVDFLDVYYQNWHFPAFNIADSAIFLGAVLLLIDAFSANKEQVKET